MAAYHFFLKHAGYSVGADETRMQGRIRCAQALARAERDARDRDVTFEWSQDDITNRDHEDITEDTPEYYLWQVLAKDARGEVFASLGAVDFGQDRDPWMDDYRRVVEAELALELPEPDIIESEN